MADHIATMPKKTKQKSKNELAVEAEFKKHKKALIDILGNKALNNHTLDTVGKHLFGHRYAGTFAADRIKFQKKSIYCIANLDTTGGPGSHWVAIVKRAGVFHVYDSFARKAVNILPDIKKLGDVVDSDRTDAEQRSGEICGQLCLAFLLCVDEFGIDRALLI